MIYLLLSLFEFIYLFVYFVFIIVPFVLLLLLPLELEYQSIFRPPIEGYQKRLKKLWIDIYFVGSDERIENDISEAVRHTIVKLHLVTQSLTYDDVLNAKLRHEVRAILWILFNPLHYTLPIECFRTIHEINWSSLKNEPKILDNFWESLVIKSTRIGGNEAQKVKQCFKGDNIARIFK